MYDSACEYIEKFGWSLVRLPPKSKGDSRNDPGWNKKENAIDTIEKAKVWKNSPDNNMGLLLEYSGIVSIDIDHEEYSRHVFYVLGLDYDLLLEDAPRIVGRTGRDKALFRAPVEIALKYHKLEWPGKTQKDRNITVFELRCGKIQDVLPPSIHPDTKMPYSWARHPDAGIPDLPKEIIAIWSNWSFFEKQLQEACPWAPEIEKPPIEKKKKHHKKQDNIIEKYNSIIDVRDILLRNGYVKKPSGRYLSPNSSSGIAGVIVFPDNTVFSHHASDPLSCSHTHDAFDLFMIFEHAGNINSAVKAAAKLLNIKHIEYDPDAIAHGKSISETFLKNGTKKQVDNEISKIPGVLQYAVDYYQETARKPQIDYAIACALALGSICLSRNWRSCQNNYTGLYFLIVGKSSTGKEHSKTVLETVLRLSGEQCMSLIGPPGYTSAGAIISTLRTKPRHICIQDEMGKQLQHAMASKNSQKDAAYTMLMEAFGRQDGFLSSDAYSNLSGKRQDLEDTGITIDRPGITIFGISTPSTLYKVINTDSISSGYLPRFIIVESNADRQISRWIDTDISPHPDLLKWCAAVEKKTGTSGNISAYIDPPEPHMVKFHPDCRQMLETYELEIIKIQNGLDVFGIAELWGKTKEIAQRISLIIACSCSSDVIQPEHLRWAIKYCSKHFLMTTERVKTVVSNSDFEGICKEVLNIVQASGIRGATNRELYKKSGLVRSLDTKGFDAVMVVLQESHGIEFAAINHKGAGRPRMAWVSPEIIME
ncbi:DUF3987 domain-containing protein [bacterium]|nr:MAG: DUF3987 domain-containing protein [bacterium]